MCAGMSEHSWIGGATAHNEADCIVAVNVQLGFSLHFEGVHEARTVSGSSMLSRLPRPMDGTRPMLNWPPRFPDGDVIMPPCSHTRHASRHGRFTSCRVVVQEGDVWHDACMQADACR